MSERRKLRRKLSRGDGNVIHLPLPPQASTKHVFVEQLIGAAIKEASRRGMGIGPMDGLTAFCRLTANLAATMAVPVEELLAAIETHYARERAELAAAGALPPSEEPDAS